MNTNFRNTLLVTLLACGLMACTSQASNQSGTGGSGAAGAGGTTTPTGTGGAGPDAGTTGLSNGEGTLCAAPQALITDFTYSASSTSTTEVHFGTSGTFSGGESVWTNSTTSPLTSDVTQGNWHISGTVDNYAGFNLYFDNCTRLDASAYTGIRFTISGSLGGGALAMGMGTLNDAVAASWLIGKNVAGAKATDPGCCVPTSGSDKYSQQDCVDPTKAIPVTATPTVISLAWKDFAGGKPVSYVEPKDIVSIYWYFTWSSGSSYPVDITLDDISFIP